METPSKTPRLRPQHTGNDTEVTDFSLTHTAANAPTTSTSATNVAISQVQQNVASATTTAASPSPRQRSAHQIESSSSRRFGTAFNSYGHPISLHVYTGEPPEPAYPMPLASHPMPLASHPMPLASHPMPLASHPVTQPMQPLLMATQPARVPPMSIPPQLMLMGTPPDHTLQMPVAAQPLKRMSTHSVNWPPYNRLGRIAHAEPSLLSQYQSTDSSVWRGTIWKRATTYYRDQVPHGQKSQARGHAEAPTTYTFSEHVEGVRLMIDEAAIPGKEPVVSCTILCQQDGVVGLYNEWRSIDDAEYFVYRYKTDMILKQSAPTAEMLLPPRFVEQYKKSSDGGPLKSDEDTSSQAARASGNSQGGSRIRPADSNNGSGDSNSEDTTPSFGCPTGCRTHTQAMSTTSLQVVGRRQATSVRSGPNQISPEKINAGRDVRTTVMMRGIPREVMYSDLKALVDQICPGRYDFIYLRANFTTGLNVGYAFINFVDCLVLLHFYRVMHGLPMPGWESDAEPGIIEMVYADCQGLDSMLDRFRNSAIMQGAYDHRPHAYYTVNDGNDDLGNPLVGKEQAFPRPNNLTRLDRSIARTQAEGLFTGSARRGRGGGRARGQDRDRGNGGVAQVNAHTSNASVSNDLEVKLTHYKHHPRNAELLALIENAGY